MPVTVTIDHVQKILKSIRALTDARVLVGVPSDSEQPHKGVPPIGTERRTGGQQIGNAALAYIHNFGSPANNIPQREFMAPGIRNAQTAITNYLGQAGRAMLDGDVDAADRAMNAAGLAAQNSVRAKIQEGPFVPLADSTVRRRTAKAAHGASLSAADIAAGFKDITPLVDTAQMRNSISYVVRKGKAAA